MTTHSNKKRGDTSNGRSSHARRTGHHIAHAKSGMGQGGNGKTLLSPDITAQIM